MKVCLINPPRLLKLLSLGNAPSPPLGLAFIAGALKNAGHQVQVIDALGTAPDKYTKFIDDIYLNGLTEDDIAHEIEEGTDIIGFSFMFSGNWLHHRKLIDYVGQRHPQSVLVAGGEHTTAVPEYCISQTTYLNSCIVGEGEETIVELVHAIQHNHPFENIEGIVYRNEDNLPVRTPPRKRIENLDGIDWPDWSAFPLDKYDEHNLTLGVEADGFSMPVLGTRGCPFRCTFCSSPQMWGTKYNMRDPMDVVDEIEFLKNTYGCKSFDFYDLTAIIKKDWIIDFSKELLRRELDIKWQIPGGTRSEAIDREVAHYIHKSGCRNVTYAPESGSIEMLKIIKKKVSLPNMLKSIAQSNKENINIKINMILGFPDEKHKHIWQTIFFLVKASWHGVHDMFPSTFSPYPGSELFSRLVKEGKINIKNDEYFYKIACKDTFTEREFYNENMSKYALRAYTFIYLLAFYGSNYLFRPGRLIRTIRNLITKNYESRAELFLSEVMKRKKVKAIQISQLQKV